MKYIITKHAVHRFVGRCRLALNKSQLQYPKSTMLAFLDKSVSHPYCKLYPQYLNMKGISDIRTFGNFKFYMKGNKVVTCTFIPNEKSKTSPHKYFEI